MGMVNLDDLFCFASTEELLKLFVAHNQSTFPFFTKSHQEPYLQQPSNFTDLPFNTLRHTAESLVTPTLPLEDPLHTSWYVHIATQLRSLGRAKEYWYLYTANTILFNAIYHPLAVLAHANTHQAVQCALSSIFKLHLKL